MATQNDLIDDFLIGLPRQPQMHLSERLPIAPFPDLVPLAIGEHDGQEAAQADDSSEIRPSKTLYTSKKYARSSKGREDSPEANAESESLLDSSKARQYGIRGRCFTDRDIDAAID